MKLVTTREFDIFHYDAERYAVRLHKAGKLLEIYIQPGCSHFSTSHDEDCGTLYKKYF